MTKAGAMDTAFLARATALGAITGVRSMSGPTAWALGHDGSLKHVAAVLAAGEMLADKTPLVGDRTAPIPLTGRAVLGALVGAGSARDARGPMLAGALAGAAAAVISAYLAWHVRRRLPLPGPIGGVLEDALVVVLAGWCVRSGPVHERRPPEA
jgi:uncharacterized membrane protein